MRYTWVVVAVVLGVGVVIFIPSRRKSLPTSPILTPAPALVASPLATKPIQSKNLLTVAAAYNFSASIPVAWEVEVVPEIEALNFYDPTVHGATSREKSQIFMRYFRGSSFLTLSAVAIHDRTETTIGSYAAVRYDIEKKANEPAFPHQPAWRNMRHVVTDMRTSSDSPTVFYVVAKRPELDEVTYQSFLQSLVTPSPALQEPVADFKTRITKKFFGTYVTPLGSPVQPERFSGYHTGVDVEYADATSDVPVSAVADGDVVLSRTADGYGGVVAVQHVVDGQTMVAIYGHLDPSTMTPHGTNVKARQKIGVLGEDKSPETDGERKHLHFALKKGTTVDLKGYVANKDELTQWVDPLLYFK